MLYNDIEDVKRLVREFEGRRIALEEWTHAAHLAVCCWYVMTKPHDAERLMRTGLQRLNRSLDIITTPTNGYHETLTRFWIAKVRSLVNVCEGTNLAVLNAVLEGLADVELVYFHYSRARISSVEARSEWVEPDLVALPADEEADWEGARQIVG